VLVVFALVLLAAGCVSQSKQQHNYGVFLGVSPEDVDKIAGYDTVVIDAQYFTQEEISQMQQNGTTVYTYLNIGSIETFREGYDSVKDCILSPYDNWPDEYWVDVSQAAWQNFIVNEAKSLAEKGVDGFFLDNADVYYLYPTSAVYKGLNAILQTLSQYDKPVLINGGDVFVTKAVLDANEPNPVITGVNQECVFTNIDFDHGKLIRQDTESTTYYQEYLARCKSAGLDVYLTEYAIRGDGISAVIDTYCNDYGYQYYISPSVNLDAN